jgi:hypothetical protein
VNLPWARETDQCPDSRQYQNTKVLQHYHFSNAHILPLFRAEIRTHLHRLSRYRYTQLEPVTECDHSIPFLRLHHRCVRLHIRTFILQLQNASFTNYYLNGPRSQQLTIHDNKPRPSISPRSRITSTFNHLDLRPSTFGLGPYKEDFLLDPTVPTPSK